MCDCMVGLMKALFRHATFRPKSTTLKIQPDTRHFTFKSPKKVGSTNKPQGYRMLSRRSRFQVDTRHCQKFDLDTRHSDPLHGPSWWSYYLMKGTGTTNCT